MDLSGSLTDGLLGAILLIVHLILILFLEKRRYCLYFSGNFTPKSKSNTLACFCLYSAAFPPSGLRSHAAYSKSKLRARFTNLSYVVGREIQTVPSLLIKYNEKSNDKLYEIAPRSPDVEKR